MVIFDQTQNRLVYSCPTQRMSRRIDINHFEGGHR